MGFAKKNKHNNSDAPEENVQEVQETTEVSESPRRKKKRGSSTASSSTSSSNAVSTNTSSTPVKTGRKKKGGMADLFAETVPEQILDEFSSNEPFIVTRNGETQYVGILIKAEDMGGLDKKSSGKDADKGQLVQQLNSGVIAAYFTQQLLQDEEIVIIPNATSMANIEEFGMVKSIPWYFVYVNTDGDIEKTDVETGFDDISNILKGNYSIADKLDDVSVGDATEDSDVSDDESTADANDNVGGSSDEYNAPYEDEIMSEDEYEAQEGHIKSEYDGNDDSSYQDDTSVYQDNDYDYGVGPDDYGTEYSDEYSQNYGDDDYNEYDEFAEGVPAPMTDVPLDDGIEITQEQVQEAIIRKFYSDELGLEVSTDPFDSQFIHGNELARFDENRPEGWLNNYLNEMCRNANVELQQMHAANLYKMKEYYLEAMAKHCEAIQKELDILDPSTVYGQQAELIRKDMIEDKNKIDDKIAMRKMEINQEWEAKLAEVADAAAQDAKNRYRDRYGRQHDQDLLQIGPMIRDEVEMNYQMSLRDMNQRRRNEALKRLDYSVNETLAEVASMYLSLLEEEHNRHKQLEEEIKEYLDDNRKDDVARSEALAEELRQSQKADAVIAEYTEKLKGMSAEFESKRMSMQSDLERMARENELAVQAKEDEWRKKYNESEKIRDDQSSEINSLLDKYTTLDAQKTQEFSSRINELKNEKDSWEDKCNHIVAANKHTNTATIFLTVIAVIAALAIGFIAGEFANLKANQNNTNAAIVQEYQQRLDELEDQNDALVEQLKEDNGSSDQSSTDKDGK